jgi:hypothetical protein
VVLTLAQYLRLDCASCLRQRIEPMHGTLRAGPVPDGGSG